MAAAVAVSEVAACRGQQRDQAFRTLVAAVLPSVDRQLVGPASPHRISIGPRHVLQLRGSIRSTDRPVVLSPQSDRRYHLLRQLGRRFRRVFQPTSCLALVIDQQRAPAFPVSAVDQRIDQTSACPIDLKVVDRT